MKFVLLINLNLVTIANSFLHNIVEHEKFSGIFIFISRENFMLSWVRKLFYNLGARTALRHNRNEQKNKNIGETDGCSPNMQ